MTEFDRTWNSLQQIKANRGEEAYKVALNFVIEDMMIRNGHKF